MAKRKDYVRSALHGNRKAKGEERFRRLDDALTASRTREQVEVVWAGVQAWMDVYYRDIAEAFGRAPSSA